MPRACEKSALNARNEATSSLSMRTGANCGTDDVDADVADALGWIFLGTSSAGLAVENEKDEEEADDEEVEEVIAVSNAAMMRSIAGASRCA